MSNSPWLQYLIVATEMDDTTIIIVLWYRALPPLSMEQTTLTVIVIVGFKYPCVSVSPVVNPL